jgi:hypothetical protein
MYRVFESFDAEKRQAGYEWFMSLPPNAIRKNWRDLHTPTYKCTVCPIGAVMRQYNPEAMTLPTYAGDIEHYIPDIDIRNEDVVDFIEDNDDGTIDDLRDAMGVE